MKVDEKISFSGPSSSVPSGDSHRRASGYGSSMGESISNMMNKK